MTLRELHASFVAQHGSRRVARALMLSALALTQKALERATEVREERDRQWHVAQAEHDHEDAVRWAGYVLERERWEASDRRGEEPAPPGPFTWGPRVWGALGRLAAAGQNEAIWVARCDAMARRLVDDFAEAGRERVVQEWRGGWTE